MKRPAIVHKYSRRESASTLSPNLILFKTYLVSLYCSIIPLPSISQPTANGFHQVPGRYRGSRGHSCPSQKGRHPHSFSY